MYNKKTRVALAIAIIPTLVACGDTPTDPPVERVLFYLASNGTTVLCPDAAAGGVGAVDGVEYTKRNRSGVEDLVRAANYDALATTCTSGVTDMSFLFESASAFDEPIDSWDVSSVTTTEGMFFGALAFNQPIGSWDVGRVTDMSGMFRRAVAFDQDISGWDVSSTRILDTMFLEATSFNQLINAWDVSNVTEMGWMFSNAVAFNQDLSGWCAALIPSPPTSFDAGATSWVLPRPVWGTCP